MRTFGYLLIVCGIGLVGYGIFEDRLAMRKVRGMETQLVEARKKLEASKGTAEEAEARAAVEAMQVGILEEHPVAGAARAESRWWMAGGGLVVVLGMVGAVAGGGSGGRRRKTRGRYWA